jgi:hypothetical protein
MNVISVLIRDPRELLCPFLYCENTAKRHYEPESRPSPDMEAASIMILDFQLPKL